MFVVTSIGLILGTSEQTRKRHLTAIPEIVRQEKAKYDGAIPCKQRTLVDGSRQLVCERDYCSGSGMSKTDTSH